MPFVNRVRLPFKLTRPQYPEERDIFRESNGRIRVLNSIIRKRYEGETDHWPEKFHERFKIALSHDTVNIEGEKYIGGVVQDGDYTINWPDFLDYPLAKAQFFAFATPFDASNSNCGGCEEFIQVAAEDDHVAEVNENSNLNLDVLANDSICCEPIQISIVTANPDYVSLIEINDQNGIYIEIKPQVVSGTNVVLATYRVQCDSGQYDEANIIADIITGSLVPPCGQATDLYMLAATSTTLHFQWTAPVPAPIGYEYELHLATNIGVPIQSGTTTDTEVAFGGLSPDTGYRLYIRSDCGGGSFGEWQYVDSATNDTDMPPICGRYRVCTSFAFAFQTFEYYDCDGNEQTDGMVLGCREVCMIQNTPGVPVYFSGNQFMTLEYLGPC
jgi:hypothetical protein